jgi:hypothetical protein
MAGVTRSDFINSALRVSLTNTIGAAVVRRDREGVVPSALIFDEFLSFHEVSFRKRPRAA